MIRNNPSYSAPPNGGDDGIITNEEIIINEGIIVNNHVNRTLIHMKGIRRHLFLYKTLDACP